MANKDGIVVGVVAVVATALIFFLGKKKPVVPPPPPPPPGQANLYGQATDASTNQPIVQAQVSMSNIIAQAGTDTTGYYAFTGILPGAYTVSVLKQGYQSQSIDVTLQEGNNQLNVQLVPVAVAGTIFGKVTDMSGVPLSGVSVMINVIDRETWTVSTDAQGNYSVANIVPGDWATISFMKAGYQTFEESIFLQSGNTVINAQLAAIVPAPNPIFQGGDLVQIVSLLKAQTGCETVPIPPGTISPYLSIALIGTIWKVDYMDTAYPGERFYYILSRDNYLLGIPDTDIIPAPAGSVQGYAAGKMVNPDTCQW